MHVAKFIAAAAREDVESAHETNNNNDNNSKEGRASWGSIDVE